MIIQARNFSGSLAVDDVLYGKRNAMFSLNNYRICVVACANNHYLSSFLEILCAA